MNYLQLISIALEVIIASLFLRTALLGKKYLYGLVVTFTIYVFYDLARLFEWTISENLLTSLFLIATLGALYSAWAIMKEQK